jgi:hypothetical protein
MKRILVLHPGSVVSTADVHSGLLAGLRAHGVDVINYALHGRLRDSEKFLGYSYRRAKKEKHAIPKPTFSDICYHASVGVYERMLRFQMDGVVAISAVLLHGDTIHQMRRLAPVGVLLTESPYCMDHEKLIAQSADCAWTNERCAVDELRTVQPRTTYLPHAWLPGVHDRDVMDVLEHDVVFVGTGFSERIALLEGVDWTGIDLGLYGNWRALQDYSPLRKFVREAEIPNVKAASLYRRAKVGLNLYRTSTMTEGQHIDHAESMNPRAYELAATGSFHLSTPRDEVVEKFGPVVPTFTTSAELEGLLRHWLAHDAERQAVAARLPALVAEDTWIARGGQVLGAMRGLSRAAA